MLDIREDTLNEVPKSDMSLHGLNVTFQLKPMKGN